MLIESAWSYRFPARQRMHLKRKAINTSESAKKIAWKAQTRLCGRYRTLTRAGKNTKLVCVAIARELAGFIWDIVRQALGKSPGGHSECRSLLLEKGQLRDAPAGVQPRDR